MRVEYGQQGNSWLTDKNTKRQKYEKGQDQKTKWSRQKDEKGQGPSPPLGLLSGFAFGLCPSKVKSKRP